MVSGEERRELWKALEGKQEGGTNGTGLVERRRRDVGRRHSGVIKMAELKGCTFQTSPSHHI